MLAFAEYLILSILILRLVMLRLLHDYGLFGTLPPNRYVGLGLCGC